MKDEWVLLQCDRGGKYKGRGRGNTQRDRSTRRIECPFRLKGVRYVSDDKWHLNSICLDHNHLPSDNMAAHPIARRLTEEEKRKLNL